MDKYESDLTAFYERSREDPIAANKAADTPRELLLERFFLPFLLHYIKDLKCDAINLLKRPDLTDLIETFKEKPRKGRRRRKQAAEDEENEAPAEEKEVDLTKLTDEQNLKFRHAFVEMRLFEDTYQSNTNRKAIDLLLSSLYMISSRRLPEEITDKLDPRTFKIDNVFNKVQLVNIPEAVVLKDRVETKKSVIAVG